MFIVGLVQQGQKFLMIFNSHVEDNQPAPEHWWGRILRLAFAVNNLRHAGNGRPVAEEQFQIG